MATQHTATTVAIITLGCGRNEVDSAQLAGLLLREGREVIDDPAAADAVLVNTCTFIAPAKQESIDTVLEACRLKEDGTARAVLVVGCMAQRYPQELADAIPEADAIVGFDGYPHLVDIVDDALAGRLTDRVVGVGPAHPGSRPVGEDRALPGATATLPSLPLMVAPTATATTTATTTATVAATPAVQDALDRIPASGPRFPVRVHDGRPWAYLKIASGCDRVCTFCAIPSFRGRFRSRPLDELVAEAAYLVDGGARELVLVSENTTSWGKDLPQGRDLAPKLLSELAAIDRLERIRLMYLQPAELTDTLIEAMVATDKVANYFDLSLQHVSGPVIARMARSGNHERFGAIIDHIRSLAPDAVFRSNFILGFPGETDEDVATLTRFLNDYNLDWVGLFAFSPEDGTPAHDLDQQVPAQVAEQRVREVTEVQEQIADERSRAFVGRELEVIVQEHVEGATLARSYREAPDTDGDIMLRTDDGRDADLPVGRLVTATIVESEGVDLIAEVHTGGNRDD
ncbi:MAG: 30S ribosomal protein S12 methylthiotransferase RimO [Nitriliruptoraceae bacterium]